MNHHRQRRREREHRDAECGMLFVALIVCGAWALLIVLGAM